MKLLRDHVMFILARGGNRFRGPEAQEQNKNRTELKSK